MEMDSHPAEQSLQFSLAYTRAKEMLAQREGEKEISLSICAKILYVMLAIYEHGSNRQESWLQRC